MCAVPLKSGGHEKNEEGLMCVMDVRGDYPTPSDGSLAKFRGLIQPRENGCIDWTGPRTPKGYGMFSYQGRCVRAHRFSYLLSAPAPIDRDTHLDHTCRNRACVNPAHLEPVTPRENIMRSPVAPASLNARKTHCPQGHPYSGDNLMLRKSGIRECRECGRQETRRYLAKRRSSRA